MTEAANRAPRDVVQAYVVACSRVAAGRIAHTAAFFGPMLPAPEWRRDLTTPLPDTER